MSVADKWSVRCFVLLALTLGLGGCERTSPEQLAPCWSAKAFKDRQKLVGRVIILITLPPPDQRDPASLVMVAPMECEHGSFAVEGRFLKPLLRQAANQPAIGKSWDRAFVADIEGLVRLDRSNLEGSHPQAPERLVLSRVENLKPIAHPHWGHW